MNEECLNQAELKSELDNQAEDLVLETMEELLDKEEYEDICKCKSCLLDIASYALNRLPAKYVAHPKEDLQTKITEFENQVSLDVVSSVENAIKVVAKNPRHNL